MYKFVKNHKEILDPKLRKSTLSLRKLALDCLEMGIESVLPKNLIKRSLNIENGILSINHDLYDLRDYKTIYIIGGGKASINMAYAIEELLKKYGNIKYKGIINAPEFPALEEKIESKIKWNIANHPIPDENGLEGTKQMLEFIKNSTKHDLIICLISGGGSALLPLPHKGISLKDLKEVNSLLLKSGASIHEINTIRKHISDLKGGNLSKRVYNNSGAKLISLIISDVIGNDLDSIASGPTVPDSSTFKDSLEIINKYNLYHRFPDSIITHIEEGINNSDLETPKEENPCFKNTFNYLIGSVESAIRVISDYLKEEGFEVNYFTNEIKGEAKEYGVSLAQNLKEKLSEDYFHASKALLGSGEMTVTIKGRGIGGRNQEMLLSFLKRFTINEQIPNFLILGANLDGIEGNSSAMGAFIDKMIMLQLNIKKINFDIYLENNDSNSFFKNIKSQIITGPTGCNVNDLLLILFQNNKFI